MARNVEKQLGKRVARLREVAGLTQAELAEDVGVATETISRLERGATIPSVARLDDVAHALGVEIRDLFVPSAPATAKAQRLDEFVAYLMRLEQDEIKLIEDIAKRIFGRS